MSTAPMSTLSFKPVLLVLVAIAAGMATLSVAAPEVVMQPVRSKAVAAPIAWKPFGRRRSAKRWWLLPPDFCATRGTTKVSTKAKAGGMPSCTAPIWRCS